MNATVTRISRVTLLSTARTRSGVSYRHGGRFFVMEGNDAVADVERTGIDPGPERREFFPTSSWSQKPLSRLSVRPHLMVFNPN